MSRSSVRLITTMRWLLVVALVPALGAACSAFDTVSTRPASAELRGEDGENPALNVPPGHLPAPGMCRVWFPGRPPGRQARAVACGTAMANAPAGSWVLYRANATEVHARVIDPNRRGVVTVVRVYSVNEGRYIRRERH